MRRALLVRAEHAGLQRRVPRLDQVAGLVTVRRQPVGQRHHQRVPAGAQPHLERADVEQHPVAGLRAAGERGVGQRPDRRALDGHVDLDRARPLPPQAGNHAAAPPDHEGRLADGGSRRRAAAAGNRATVRPAPRRGTVRCGRARAGPGGGQERAGRTTMSRRKTERLLSLVVCLLSAGKYLTAAPDQGGGARLPGVLRRVQAHVRAGQGRAARAGDPAGDRGERDPGRGARIPDPAPGLRAARDQAGAGRGRRPRPRRPGLAARRAGRGGGRRPAQAARRRDRRGGDHAAGHRAAAADG